MKITKDKNNLIIKIPLRQQENNCYMDDDELREIDNICGYIEKCKNGMKRLGFAYIIDLSYKGSTQYSGIFLEYSGMSINPPIEEFEELCRELNLQIIEE